MPVEAKIEGSAKRAQCVRPKAEMFVTQIQLRNFKSFANATVKLQKGFNCIVGPNGSGKSNVIDSLLFAFGESRLRAMRVKRSSDLIFQNNKVAEATVTLNNGSGETHTVMRMVKRDGKTKYALDGKRTKRYAIEEFLASNTLSLANIIKQGEVQRIVEMDSRDRRAMIDVVANVSEYEEKKREAMGELGQVEAKLRESTTLLNEREGYLAELEQEKNNAIKYKGLKARFDSLKATILTIDFRAMEAEFEAVINSMLDSENKLKAIEARVRELENAIRQKNSEKDDVNKLIIERSHGEEAELQRAIDALNIGIETSKRAVEEKGAALKETDAKLHGKTLEHVRASDEVKGALAQTSEIERELESLSKILFERNAEYDKLLKSSAKFSTGFQNARAFIDRAGEEMLAIKEELSRLQADASKNEELARMKEREADRIRMGEFADYSQRKSELEAQKKELSRGMRDAQESLDALFERERKLNERVPVLEDLLLVAKEKCAEISIRLRSAGESGGKAAEAIEFLKEEKGVYGTVEELCAYSSKYSVPVQVAFGSRANFVIVDGVRTASRAIGLLKSRKLGRVSFIPLDKIGGQAGISREDRAIGNREGSLGFLIDILEFDEKYRRAFEFVCSNTLLMRDLQSAEANVGRVRMVTMDGELLEASGLMTGGTFTARVSATVERKQLEEWEKKREEARLEKDAAYEELRNMREQMNDARKRKAEAELAFKACEIEIAHLTEQERSEREKKAHVVQAVKQIEDEIKQLRAAASEESEKRSALVRKLSDLNLKMLEAKQQVDVEKEAAFGMQLKERERAINELRVQQAEYENRLASLKTQYNVYEKQAKALEREISDLQASSQEFGKGVREATEYVQKAKVELKEKTEQQKVLSSRFSDMLNKREKLEGEISKLANEKGKLEFEREKTGRMGQDERVKKAVLENSLSSLKAQLDECRDAPVLEGKGLADKAALIAESKLAQQELDALGMVNMRAIEMYEQRVHEFEEQKKRVEQLFNEKEAVISVINEIEGKKVMTFMQTFNTINNNFKRVFSQIFKGEGTLFLENPEKPFDAGLTIQVKFENKEVKYLELMSGGEKSLIALVFIFAMQSVNPSSVYILDEADAALDAENSRKLAQLVKALSKDTQFLVVSHNPNVYKLGDALVGVAAAKDGSKLVEVTLNE